MVAPRASARSQGSSTSIAAPSPSTMPLRFFENGRHDADGSSASIVATVCNASQAFSEPGDNGASAPPAIATSSSPRATRSQASPIATVDDEQAVE